MYFKPFVEAAAPAFPLKGEIFFRSACGQIVEADLLREEVSLERTLMELARIAFNTGRLERHHGDIIHLDGRIEQSPWGAPVLPTWTIGENEAKHIGSLLLCYGEDRECGILEVWKRPSR